MRLTESDPPCRHLKRNKCQQGFAGLLLHTNRTFAVQWMDLFLCIGRTHPECNWQIPIQPAGDRSSPRKSPSALLSSQYNNVITGTQRIHGMSIENWHENCTSTLVQVHEWMKVGICHKSPRHDILAMPLNSPFLMTFTILTRRISDEFKLFPVVNE